MVELFSMSIKNKKNDLGRIFVQGGKSQKADHKAILQQDVTLLALQLACPQRWEPGGNALFDDTHEIYNLWALTVETKLFSSLIIVGTNSSKKKIDASIKPLKLQLQNIIKSALEKVYFIESFQVSDPQQLEWKFFTKMSDYCFMHETTQGSSFISYFRLEKTNDDDQFSPRSMDSVVDGEIVEQDVYLFFKKNNRYIKVLKKGDAVEKKRMDRLQSKGINDLYITADQGIEIQQRRVRHILLELLDDYAALIGAA